MKYDLKLWLIIIAMLIGMIVLIPVIFVRNCLEWLYYKLTNNKEKLECWEGD